MITSHLRSFIPYILAFATIDVSMTCLSQLESDGPKSLVQMISNDAVQQ